MIIGVPKETKIKENRVAMTPQGVASLVGQGHHLKIEMGAGLGSGFTDQQYQQAGAALVTTAEAWDCALVVKVKEPLPTEYSYLAQQRVFTFFHLTGVDPQLTQELVERKTTAIAYETLEDENGRLPILAPMSAIAGNMAALMGAYYQAAFNGGHGVQTARILGKPSGKVLIIGDGIVGQHAANIACGMGASVTIAGLDKSNFDRFQADISDQLQFIQSTAENIQAQVIEADVVIGAVLCKGAKAPKVLTEPMLKTMQPGSVVVDVSIDQGGCFETSRATTHDDPVYSVHDVIHYCVSNMPGAYPRTSTFALSDVTLAYIEQIAAMTDEQLIADPYLRTALNTWQGNIVYRQVAEDLGRLAHYSPLNI